MPSEYFLGDALGSVRQLVNASGTITLGKSYTPYGEVRSTAGSGTSPFAYTGEQMDVSGLTYLRSRYYSGGTGRFISRDTWDGNANMPMSFNRWNYVDSNPINRVDPTGMCWINVGGVNVWIPDGATPCQNGNPGTPLPQYPGLPSDVLSYLNDCDISEDVTSQGGAPDTVDGGLGPRGKTLYRLYTEMWNMRGNTSAWWWQVYGNDRDGFTLVDFIATIYVRELANAQNLTDRNGKAINMNDFVEAMGRHAYSWCKDGSKFPKSFTCDSTTNRGLLFFIASWSQTAIGIADGCSVSCNLLDHFKNDYSQSNSDWALKVAKGIKNPSSSWMQFDKNALWDAGNPHALVIKKSQIEEMHTKYQHNAHFESADGLFFLTTYCETLFLRGDIAGFTAEGCVLSPSY
jgi:RHS repeat-associated protein